MLIPVNLPPTHQRTALTGAQPSRLRSTNRVLSTLSGYERLPFTGKQANQLFFINYFLKCLQKYRTEEKQRKLPKIDIEKFMELNNNSEHLLGDYYVFYKY